MLNKNCPVSKNIVEMKRKSLKHKPLIKNGKRMEMKYRIRRTILYVVILVILLGLGSFIMQPAKKILFPTSYLNTLSIESVVVNEIDNTYLDNFLETLDVSKEVDIRDLRAYVLDLNDMNSSNEYHGSYSLKVPVIK